jgi:hypothetical protein
LSTIHTHSKYQIIRHNLAKQLLLLVLLGAGLSVRANEIDTTAQNAECSRSASYFAEFYVGLQTMHSHGLKNFTPGSADANAYFIQVQKNGEKVEMNVLKNLRSDGTLSPSVKDSLIKLNQSVAQSMRRMAEQDSLAQVLRDKEVVKADLTKVCSH